MSGVASIRGGPISVFQHWHAPSARAQAKLPPHPVYTEKGLQGVPPLAERGAKPKGFCSRPLTDRVGKIKDLANLPPRQRLANLLFRTCRRWFIQFPPRPSKNVCGRCGSFAQANPAQTASCSRQDPLPLREELEVKPGSKPFRRSKRHFNPQTVFLNRLPLSGPGNML